MPDALTQLLQLADGQQLYQDLTRKHLILDFYQVTADCLDPHQQTALVTDLAHVLNPDSKTIIKESYAQTAPLINQMNPHYNYPTSIPDEQTPVIIFTEVVTDEQAPRKIRQVLPFNLWLAFATPIMVQEPHLLQAALTKQLDPLIHQYVNYLLINWLSIPWYLFYKQQTHQRKPAVILDHGIASYQINRFAAGLTVSFTLAQPSDQPTFQAFIADLKPYLPAVVHLEHEPQQLIINLS